MASDNEEDSPYHGKKRVAEPLDDERHKRARHKSQDISDKDYRPLPTVASPSPPPYYTHADYTVGWICALPLEMKAATAMLDDEHPSLPIPSNDHNAYILGSIAGHNVVIACLPVGVYGTTTATVVAVSMSSTFPNSTRIPLMAGIGGGVPSNRHDIRLGDVVVSTPSSDHPAVVQYDRGKTIGTGVIDPRGTLNKPAHILLTAISAIQAQYGQNLDGIAQHISQALSQDKFSTFKYPGSEADVLYKSGCSHLPESTSCEECGLQRVKRTKRDSTYPRVHYGTIGSGNQVIKHAATRDRIAAQHGDILCFEMEAAGIMDYIPCLVVRGICDYADAFKNKEFQGYAALAAAAFAKELLTFLQSRTAGGKVHQQRHKLMLKNSILEALAFPELDNRRATIKNAHPRTCAWLVETPKYLKWTDSDKMNEHYGLLWIKGKPGTGKSTIMKFLLERFERSSPQNQKPVVISFFFNARGQSLEKSTIGMYRSLVRQLLDQVPDSYAALDNISMSNFREAIQQVTSCELLFRKVIIHLKSVHILCLIDALDECPEDEIQDMVDCFQELGNMASLCHFQICFSSRHYPKISIDIGLELALEEERGHDKDIIDYIDSELQIGSGDHAQKLRDDLFEKSNGIFLWVILVIRILKREVKRGRIHTLSQTLQETPEGLDALLSDILLRDTRNISELVLCMQWILYSQRPLERQELYFALLSTSDVSISWPTAEISTQIMDDYILDCSKGLAELTRTTPPVLQFIHESVREILLKPSFAPSLVPLLQQLHPNVSHQCLSKCCYNYLISEQVKSFDFDVIYIGSFTPTYGESTDTSLLKFHRLKPEIKSKLPFLGYSVEFVLKHTDQAGGLDTWQAEFLQAFDRDHWIKIYRSLRNYNTRHSPHSSVSDRNGVFEMISFLIHQKDHKVCYILCQNLNNSSAVFDNEFKQYFDAIYELLEDLQELLDESKGQGQYYLGDIDSVASLLLNYKRQGQNLDLNIALKLAALLKQKDTIQLLSDHGADLMPSILLAVVEEPRHYDSHAFKWRQNPRSTDGKDYVHGSAARAAAKADMAPCLKFLVDKGLNVGAKDSDGVTVLHKVAGWGGKDSTSYLMNASKDINSQDCLGGTPLHYAAFDRSASVARVLLANGARTDIQNSTGWTPLHLAVHRGAVAFVEVMLEHNASVNITDKQGNTPLHLVVQAPDSIGTNDISILRLLLEHGADVHAKNHEGRIPSQILASSHNEDIIKLVSTFSSAFGSLTRRNESDEHGEEVNSHLANM